MCIKLDGWANKKGTSNRSCGCGTWKNHWSNSSDKSWPSDCSKKDCTNTPVLGAHIYNSKVTGEQIVPFCDSCNKLSETFSLNVGVVLIPANKSKTCEQNK